MNIKYEIKNDYIYVPNENLGIGEKYLLKSCGMTNKGKYYKGKDDVIKRVLLGIPIEPKYLGKEKKATFSKLYKYQKEDVEFMTKLGTALNANIMGLGKSLEAIITLNMLGCNKVLIVCPKTIKYNWKKELQKWMKLPGHLITVIDGTPSQRKNLLENHLDVPFVIVNYALIRTTTTARNKVETNETLKALQKIEWDLIIADEAHKIKNPKSQQTKGLKSLRSKYKIPMTGTPIQNKPNDLYSILHWMDSYYSSNSYWRFVEHFCETFDNGYGLQIVGLTKDKAKQEMLNSILKHIMVRRENSDELPDVMSIPIEVKMDSKQEKLYKQIQTEILVELEELQQDLFINSAMTRLLRLQQCTSNPELFGLKTNPKFEAALDLLEGCGDDKIVFFSRFKQTINAFAKWLDKAKIKYVELTGDTKDRQAVIDKFIDDKNIRCFIATIGAASEGIDGLQTVCNKMVFFDREWSPAKNQQAQGRLVRNGQKDSVRIYDIMCIGTIDKYVEKVLNKKISDIKKLIGEI